MSTLVQILIAVGFVILILALFQLYTSFLGKLTQNAIKRRIAKGKVSDEQLIKLYHMNEKGRNRKFTAFLFYGIFYKSFLKMQDGTYQLYKSEMEKRGLLTKES